MILCNLDSLTPSTTPTLWVPLVFSYSWQIHVVVMVSSTSFLLTTDKTNSWWLATMYQVPLTTHMHAYLPNVLPIFGRHQISSGSLLQCNKVLLASFLPHCPIFFCLSKDVSTKWFSICCCFCCCRCGQGFFFPPQFCDVAS